MIVLCDTRLARLNRSLPLAGQFDGQRQQLSSDPNSCTRIAVSMFDYGCH
jgi:hypothetical protein